MRTVCKFFVLGAALLSASAANAQGCRAASDMEAIGVRSLHTELMVSALACIGQTEDSFRNRYGAYVQKFNVELVRNCNLLKSRFPGRSLDTFITQLANLVAQRSKSDPNFCIDADRKLNVALAANTTTIAQIPPASDYAGSLGMHACTPAAPKPAATPKK